VPGLSKEFQLEVKMETRRDAGRIEMCRFNAPRPENTNGVTYFFAGEVLSSRSTSAFPASGVVSPPSMICFAVIDFP